MIRHNDMIHIKQYGMKALTTVVLGKHHPKELGIDQWREIIFLGPEPSFIDSNSMSNTNIGRVPWYSWVCEAKP